MKRAKANEAVIETWVFDGWLYNVSCTVHSFKFYWNTTSRSLVEIVLVLEAATKHTSVFVLFLLLPLQSLLYQIFSWGD